MALFCLQYAAARSRDDVDVVRYAVFCIWCNCLSHCACLSSCCNAAALKLAVEPLEPLSAVPGCENTANALLLRWFRIAQVEERSEPYYISIRQAEWTVRRPLRRPLKL